MLWTMTGVITFSSNWPACAAIVTTVSFPTIWNAIISAHSAMTGFTLPGMIEDPG